MPVCVLLLVAGLLTGCPSGDGELVDGDGDGYFGFIGGGDDCNDTDPGIHPGANEVCNGLDDNCDGAADEGTLLLFYFDGDSDGFGDPESSLESCDAAIGYVESDTDCDDSNRNIHPEARELCDGLDNNCDGIVDLDAEDRSVVYEDVDGDGFGNADRTAEACDVPEGFAAVSGDCDDDDPASHPGAPETDCTDPTDYNCDGSTTYVDNDGDGAAACVDCNDAAPGIFPGAAEICDGVDQNCDQVLDDGFDTDGDGFTSCGGDCDDDDPRVRPNATEDCSAVTDLNCDGLIGLADGDGDGFGACDDCNDAAIDIFPGAVETCDARDEDCDGTIDNGFDSDGDGATTCAGDCDDFDPAFRPGAPESCSDPNDYNCDGVTSFVDNDGDGSGACVDCDDGLSDVFPGAIETCDGRDEDCDGTVDNGFDLDGDGVRSCAGDCDDAEPTVFAGAPEQPYDGIDQDCDGSDLTDLDGDGHDGPDGVGADCDDSDPAVHPGVAQDLRDGIDNDCDTQVDEGPFTYTYLADVQPVFTATCTQSNCHDSNNPADDLDLTSNAWPRLVDVPARDVPTLDQIEPLDPLTSYVMHKLNNTHRSVGGAGSSMPKGAPLLPIDTRRMIETWILEGAPP